MLLCFEGCVALPKNDLHCASQFRRPEISVDHGTIDHIECNSSRNLRFEPHLESHFHPELRQVAIVLQRISRAVVSQEFAKRLCPCCPERRFSGWSQIRVCAPFEQDPPVRGGPFTDNHSMSLFPFECRKGAIPVFRYVADGGARGVSFGCIFVAASCR